MDRTLTLMILSIATIIAWNIDSGPLNFLWLVMLIVDFWAVVAILGYSAVIGLIHAVKKSH